MRQRLIVVIGIAFVVIGAFMAMKAVGAAQGGSPCPAPADEQYHSTISPFLIGAWAAYGEIVDGLQEVDDDPNVHQYTGWKESMVEALGRLRVASEGLLAVDAPETAYQRDIVAAATLYTKAAQLLTDFVLDTDAYAGHDWNLEDGRDLLFAGSLMYSYWDSTRAQLCPTPEPDDFIRN